MRKAIEIYSDAMHKHDNEKCFWAGACDYAPIIKELGNVLLERSDDDYQGDTRIIYGDGDRIGYLCFGWGSCSGCDALQNCDSFDEIDELMENLKNQIRWFDTPSEALQFFKEHDWRGDYGHDERFVNEGIKLLAKIVNEKQETEGCNG